MVSTVSIIYCCHEIPVSSDQLSDIHEWSMAYNSFTPYQEIQIHVEIAIKPQRHPYDDGLVVKAHDIVLHIM